VTLIRSGSAWDQAQINHFLSECVIPIRLACNDSHGEPLVCSLWFLYDEGALWCATQKSASVVKLLAAAPKCGFEVAPQDMPYRGVRGQGVASVSAEAGSAVLLRLIDRYLGKRDSSFARWLQSRADNEVAIKIIPAYFSSWDFSQRMQGY
jgi:nitroimidazol reductase NimA-like FMN-containing flavoprotein (pyridoxamine 5'-phosphate oxidase superfamily)